MLALMFLALIYGGYEFFFRSSSKTPEQSIQTQLQETSEFTTGFSQKLEDLQLEPWMGLVLEALHLQADINPFYAWPYGEEPEEKEPEQVPEEVDLSLAYEGYIEMGRARLAVINGQEYQEGDILAEPGLKIINIHSDEVVLEFQSDKRRITLFFKDEF